MFAPLELFVGLRYLSARRRNQFVGTSLISVLGIAAGVCALIVVISVMNGFGNELRQRLLSLSAHATVTAASGLLTDWETLAARALEDPRIAGAAPVVAGEGMLVNGSRLNGVRIDGVLPEREPAVSDIGEKLTSGSLSALAAGGQRMLMGRSLGYLLGLEVGERVNLLVPSIAGAGQLQPVLRRFTVAGFFEVGVEDHDVGRALVHIADAADLLGFAPGTASGLRLKLRDPFDAPLVRLELEQRLGAGYQVSDWTREQATYFRAIRLEKLMMFVILSLIVAVAVFNIVASLVMVVTDKRIEIAILRTLGLEARSIMAVFMVQGMLIGLLGTVIGVACGVALALNVETLIPRLELLLGLDLVPDDVYYVAQVPSDLRWPEVGLISFTAFALASLATIYPARRAARTHPAEALRYG